MRRQHGFTALLVLAAGPVLAADNSLDAARRCAQMQDSLQRLVCYDRIFAVPATPAPAPAVLPAPPAVAAAAPDAGSFGGEQLKRSVEERRSDQGKESQRATVAALREVRPGVWRITLDNDQIWQQTESDRQFFIESGDAVVIERGLLGSYHLEQEGGSRRVRVSRIK